MILVTLARNYGRLALRSGEMPIEIHIPVFEDTGEERSSRFRVIGDIDETITSKGPEDYVGYWGLAFDRASERKVYYVAQGVLLDETFNTLDEHWNHVLWKSRLKANASSHG